MASEVFLPYGRQQTDAADLQAIREVLESDWLTTGPAVERFEEDVATFCGARFACAVNSGTAALHAALHAAGIDSGDEVIVPPLTFAATANAALYCGATPVFADVDPETLLLDPARVAAAITPQTRAIIAVDYAGQPCDYAALRELADAHELVLIADACHSLGGAYQGKPVGQLADLSAFSFHPVKPITTAEGGMVVTDNEEFAGRLKRFRSHGIDNDHHQRTREGSWLYRMETLGFNYRLSDLQCALGSSQLKKLPGWLEERCRLAACYQQQLADLPAVRLLRQLEDRSSAWHLLVVRVPAALRQPLFEQLRAAGIGVNVHYLPVYLHPYYQRLGYSAGLCPRAEAAYAELLTLPLFPAMTEEDVERVCSALQQALADLHGEGSDG